MINGKSILAVIPARGGSKELPGKNIKLLLGKPLIAWTIESAQTSQYIDKLIVSTDDNKIIEIAKHYNCDTPFVRPACLSQDDSSSVDVVTHAISEIEHHDIVMLLQPTSPLRDKHDIDSSLEILSSMNAESCASVCEADKSPYWMYINNQYGRMRSLIDAELAVKQRQQLPKVQVLNGAIYAINCGILLQKKRFITEDTVPYLMDQEHSIDIDTTIDFKLAELILNQRKGT